MRYTVCSALALLGVIACGDDEPVSVQIQFDATVDGQAPVCGQTYSGLGANSEPFTLKDLRFYVSDLRVGSDAQPVSLDDDGTWQNGRIALLDFETGGSECELGTSQTRSVVSGEVEGPVEGRGLRFTVGIPFELNHQDVGLAEGPLSLTAMFWNWQGGYKFIRVDGSSGESPFNVHLGSTACDGDPAMGGTTTCSNSNRVDVELPDFDPTTSVVEFDVARLLESATLSTNTPMTAPGCQSFPSDPECPPVFDNLGLGYGGMPPSGPQTVFRAR